MPLEKNTVSVALLAVVLGGAWLYMGKGTSLAPTEVAEIKQAVRVSSEADTTKASRKKTQEPGYSAFVDSLANQLLEKFGARIDEVAIQARLFGIRKEVLKKYPANGLPYFNRAIQQAFPEQAAGILDLMAKLEAYNEWLITENRTLIELSPLELHGVIWNKRRELFADQADLIWADERSELARKQQEVQSILAELDEAGHLGLNEMLYQLRTSLSETFEGPYQHLVDDSSMVTKVFFSLESVQRQLQRLPPVERQDRIDEVRRRLGYSESQIDRLRQRDRKKNDRWEKGRAYMAEREKLLMESDSHVREQALDKLRREFFGHEARTIKLEEESGFLRYNRPRIYGRN